MTLQLPRVSYALSVLRFSVKDFVSEYADPLPVVGTYLLPLFLPASHLRGFLFFRHSDCACCVYDRDRRCPSTVNGIRAPTVRK